MSQKQKGHDFSATIIWSASVVSVVRYAAAFIASDVGEITGPLSDVITFLMGLSGLGMGILDVIGGTYLFDGWRRAMPASGRPWSMRFKVLTGFVAALFSTGILILVPFTVSRVTHTSMAAVLGQGGWLEGWALLVNLAPPLLIGGVAIGTQVVTVAPGNFPESFAKVSPVGEEPSRNIPNDWRKARPFLSWAEVEEIAEGSTAAIKKKYPVLKDNKNAQLWRGYAQRDVAARRAAEEAANQTSKEASK